MSEFTGYQKRAVAHFREQGLQMLDEVHVLELLLFFADQPRTAYQFSHALLGRFGSLEKVMNAPMEMLEAVRGVDQRTAVLISLTGQIGRYCQTQHGMDAPEHLKTSRACAEYLMPFFSGQRHEKVYLLCLDSKANVICCREIEEGTVCSANVPIRKIMEIVLSLNAVSVVLAHNHPGGLPYPSTDDIVTTRRLAVALDGIDVLLADHIIFADSNYVSLAQAGYYRPDECKILV